MMGERSREISLNDGGKIAGQRSTPSGTGRIGRRRERERGKDGDCGREGSKEDERDRASHDTLHYLHV